MTMTRYELLQSLERLYPSRKDWFIADEDEGIVKVCFNVEVEDDGGKQPLSDYDKNEESDDWFLSDKSYEEYYEETDND